MDRVDGHEQHELRQILSQTRLTPVRAVRCCTMSLLTPFVGHKASAAARVFPDRRQRCQLITSDAARGQMLETDSRDCCQAAQPA